MTIASLLVRPESDAGKTAFNFDHAMQHRNNFQVMAPLHQWTVLPYFIDPAQSQETPGSKWHLNHQQAHNDFTSALPSDFQRDAVGIPTSQILLDSNLGDPGSLAWWTFINHQEHYIASAIVQPAIPQAQTVVITIPEPWGPVQVTIVLPPAWIQANAWILPPFW